MEEIIKELENRLGDLEYAEQADMYYLAISKVTEKQRNTFPSHTEAGCPLSVDYIQICRTGR